MRRRANSTDLGEDMLGGGIRVVSHLMSRKAQRKPSKENIDQDDDPYWEISLPDMRGCIGKESATGVLIASLFVLFIFWIAANEKTLIADDDDGITPTSPSIRTINSTAVNVVTNRAVYQDAWWMDDTTDDYLSTSFVDEDLKDKLTALRDVSTITADIFADTCGRYRFGLEKFPRVSIIIGPVYEGFPIHFLTMTVHSILARTPNQLIAEIIIVQDNPPTESGNDELDVELNALANLSDLVNVMKPRSPTSPANRVVSRNNAMLTAKSEHLVFMDPYVEIWSGTWLQQLLLPILEDPTTLAVPMVHEMSTRLELTNTGDKANYMYMMDDHFKVKRVNLDVNSDVPSSWRAYATPFFDGHMFAVRKFVFSDSIDQGLKFMDGDNIAVALKFWMCGARIVQVPCARVGLVPLSEFPEMPVPQTLIDGNGLRYNGKFLYFGETADDRTRLAVKNYMRIVRVWLPAIKDAWYDAAFGSGTLPKEWEQFVAAMNDDDRNIEAMEGLRSQCQNLEWFDKHILMTLLGVHNPWYSGSNK
jgi:hypothetical protein